MDAITNTPWRNQARSSRYIGLGVTVLLHLAALVALLHYEPFRSALRQSAPIMVSLITPEVEQPHPLPKPVPVKPKAEPIKSAAPPPPLVATQSEAPAPDAPAPQPPAPPQAAPVEAAGSKGISVEATSPLIPPVFNADYLENPPPAYPALSRRMGEQGKVIVRVLVNVNGSADRVELRTSSGSPRLDEAALETVKRWRFKPAHQGNQPVAAWVLIPISFALKG